MVPLELLKFYLGMVEQVRVQQVHNELPFLCAFSFPGVAITLGADHWHLMKPTFDILSQHMHVSRVVKDFVLCVRVRVCVPRKRSKVVSCAAVPQQSFQSITKGRYLLCRRLPFNNYIHIAVQYFIMCHYLMCRCLQLPNKFT